MRPRPIPFAITEAFWQRVEKHVNYDNPTDCWIWTGPQTGLNPHAVWYDGNLWHPARVAWRAFIGDPGRAELTSMCENGATCIKPGHRQINPMGTAYGRSTCRYVQRQAGRFVSLPGRVGSPLNERN